MGVNIAQYDALLRQQGKALVRSNSVALEHTTYTSGPNFYTMDAPGVEVQMAYRSDRSRVTKQQAAAWFGHSVVLFRDARDFFRTLDPNVLRDRESPFHIGIHIADVIHGTAGTNNILLYTGALNSSIGWGVATHELLHSIQYDKWGNEQSLFDEFGDMCMDSSSPLHIIDEILPMFFEASRLDVTSYSVPGRDPFVFVRKLPYSDYLSSAAHHAAAGLNGLLWGIRTFLIEKHGPAKGIQETHRLMYKAINLFGTASVEDRLTSEGSARVFLSSMTQLLSEQCPEALPAFLKDSSDLRYPTP